MVSTGIYAYHERKCTYTHIHMHIPYTETHEDREKGNLLHSYAHTRPGYLITGIGEASEKGDVTLHDLNCGL